MNRGVQHKMLDYEVIPPRGVWERITAALEESELDHSFPSTLYNAEATVPANTWNAIRTALDAETIVVAKRRTIPAWFRYAAAAVLIGLVAWGAVQLLKGSGKGTVKMVSSSISKTHTDSPETALININSTRNDVHEDTDREDEARNDAALENSKKTFAKLDITSTTHRLKDIAASYRFASNADLTEPSDGYADERDPFDLSNRYIILMTPDGHFVRMAKKLSSMVCCVSGEEQDKDCTDQMSRWKEKMACSPTGHSTGSFLDILSLIKSLDEQ